MVYRIYSKEYNLTGWAFINSERKRLGIKLNWKSVSVGEVYGSLTVLCSGRGKESVEAKCTCGAVCEFTAASIKSGRARRCASCDINIDRSLAWKSPKKWKNPPRLSENDKKILIAQEKRLAPKSMDDRG